MRRNRSLKRRCQSLGEPLRRLRPGTVVPTSGNTRMALSSGDTHSQMGYVGKRRNRDEIEEGLHDNAETDWSYRSAPVSDVPCVTMKSAY